MLSDDEDVEEISWREDGQYGHSKQEREGWPRLGSEIQLLISVSDSSNPPTVRILPLLYGKLQRKASATECDEYIRIFEYF